MSLLCCKECLLFVCSTISGRYGWWRCILLGAGLRFRNCRRQVRIIRFYLSLSRQSGNVIVAAWLEYDGFSRRIHHIPSNAGIRSNVLFCSLNMFCLCVPISIISSSVRGMLGSVLTLSCNSGMVFGFVIGTYLEYFTQLKVLLLLPIAFLIGFNYFPESPSFLLQQQRKNVSVGL